MILEISCIFINYDYKIFILDKKKKLYNLIQDSK